MAAAEARIAPPPPAECALCGRLFGARVEWHHVVPKSKGGTQTAPVHPICHRAIHAAADNNTLARLADLEAVRALPAMSRFLRWIANKPPDFHAPTRRPR
ncbi:MULTISPECIES: HNH endonuclease [unclassified Sphingomonas]|uniref:HNH endonuclease n=1 Tax=unclassified Sphingomonas TaxID=196159 RepID=UPI001D0FDC5C|nr:MULTISPECIES: HNH endonuclease [unclassified Sphingomonas]MCC2979424.1 HNH endonuclease [Sphingomonas sp. IC4-52]MCD2315348.1 HNH endonuclease [Sphingomonas sp. IC-11]